MSQVRHRNGNAESSGAARAARNSTNVRSRHALLRAFLALSQAISTRLTARWAESLFFRPPRPRPSKTPLPPGAQRLDVRVGSGPLAVWSWGSGPAVYLVHGWGGRSEHLGAFVAPLVARGFRVIAVDGPAHGASAGRLSSGPEIGRALAAVVARTAPAYGVVAHSLGAAAVAFAMREGLRVDRLVFVGAPADPLDWVQAFARQLGLSPRVQDELRRRSERRLRADWDDLPLVPLRGLEGPPPLLVVHDRDDREVRFADAGTIVGAWPGARLLETSGLGHQRVLRDPAVVASVSAFLSMASGRSGWADAAKSSPATDDECAHGRAAGPSPCEACALEAELFTPALRRHVPAAVTAWR